jgi:exodeoxyribonuclease VII small subunit
MEEKSFEENLEKLKELVRSLQSGELTLDESLKAFEEGIKLSKVLEDKLKNIEEKAVKLFDNGELKDLD